MVSYALRRKLKTEKDGNDSLSHEHKEEIHIFHKSMDLLICSTLNNNNNKVSDTIHEVPHFEASSIL